ncbi:MAG: hypothetical protein ACP5TL_02515 [Candidatus Micrarchaeia archaeon]
MDDKERGILQDLIRKKYVIPFKKQGEQEYKYSIEKGIYDKYLFGKRENKQKQQSSGTVQTAQQDKATEITKDWESKVISNNYMDLLESKGYIVFSNEADAASFSAELEESIKRGLIVGTRAFNKKFYIALRGFINKYAPKIIKLIEQKPLSAIDIAQKIGIEVDGARAVLYYMAETGDITEVRKDIFRAA